MAVASGAVIVIIMVLFKHIFLVSSRQNVLASHRGNTLSACPSPIEPPMPKHDCDHVKHVECDHSSTFPEVQLAVPEEDHAKTCRDNEEANVPDEALLCDLEWPD
jgi:hypothetical protein